MRSILRATLATVFVVAVTIVAIVMLPAAVYGQEQALSGTVTDTTSAVLRESS